MLTSEVHIPVTLQSLWKISKYFRKVRV